MKRLTTSRLLAMFAAWLMLACTGWAVAADYAPDPSYNNGLISQDAFASSFGNNYDGRKVVTLPNGNVVIAGRVPDVRTGTTYGAIGLIQRRDDGHRVPWTAPGAHGHYNNEYVVYPGTSDFNIVAVKDLVLHDNLLFVLADTNNGANPTVFGSRIYVFGTDGGIRNSNFADWEVSSEREVWGGGLAAFRPTPSSDHVDVVYIGRKVPVNGSSSSRITFRHFRYSLVNNGFPAQTNLIHPNISECGPSTHCSGFDIAIGGRNGSLGLPRTYITGSRTSEGIIRSMVVQIDPYTGAKTGIGYQQMSVNARGRAIAVKPGEDSTTGIDDIFVLSEKDRACKNGMVARGRIKSPGGEIFGWERLLGGSDAAGVLCNTLAWEAWPHDITYQNGRVGVAGHVVGTAFCIPGNPCENPVDGAIAVLNAYNGTEISPLRTYPFTDTAGGSRTRHSSFRGIAGTGGDTFTVVGDVTYPQSHSEPNWRGKRQFASLRVYEPAGGADIFSDDFEGDGSQPQPSWLYAPQYANNAIRVYHLVNGSYELLHSAAMPAGTKPNAVAFDGNGKLWVVGEDRRLLRFSREDVNTQPAPAPEISVAPAGSGFYFQMAFWGNNAYISNSDFGSAHRVLRIPLATLNLGGNPAAAQTFTDSGFNVPAGLAFDANGKLWISHYGGHRVTRLNVNNGTVERSIESISVGGNASLSQPEGMAFNAAGDLLVGNNGRPSYARYSAATLNGSGNTPAHLEVMSPETNPAPRTGYIGGLAMDSEGDLWFNYQREFQIRERRPNNTAGQTLDNATTDPGFGGIAFWPIPPTLHRGQ